MRMLVVEDDGEQLVATTVTRQNKRIATGGEVLSTRETAETPAGRFERVRRAGTAALGQGPIPRAGRSR